MAYVPNPPWVDGVGNTLIYAANLNHLEAGLQAAAQIADEAAAGGGGGGWNLGWPVPPVGVGDYNGGGIHAPFLTSQAQAPFSQIPGVAWMPGGWTIGHVAVRVLTLGAVGDTCQVWYLAAGVNGAPAPYAERVDYGPPIPLDATGFQTNRLDLVVPEGGLWFGVTSASTTAQIDSGPCIGPWANWSTGGTASAPVAGPPPGGQNNPDLGNKLAPSLNFWRKA
jgi:hypothetical protein